MSRKLFFQQLPLSWSRICPFCAQGTGNASLPFNLRISSLAELMEYEEIISAHRTKIREARCKANRYLFIDTDALTTYWYAQLGEIDLPRPTRDDFDLVLFMDANVPFIQDGLRSNENNTDIARISVSDTLKQFYLSAGYSFHIINGSTHAERLKQAIQYIEAA